MPEQHVEFDSYRTTYDVVRARQKDAHVAAEIGSNLKVLIHTGLKPVEFIDRILKAEHANILAGQRPDALTIGSLGAMVREWRWYRANRPRFRVYPHMLEALAGISIDIDSEHLRLPFQCFSVEFPKDHFREHENAPYLRGMLIFLERPGDKTLEEAPFKFHVSDKSRAGVRVGPPLVSANMFVDMDFGDEEITSPVTKLRELSPCKPYAIFGCEPGLTIDQHFEAMPERPLTDDGYMPSHEFQKVCLRIAVGIAFLAINHHEVIEQIIPPGLLKQRERAAAQGNKKRLAKITNELHQTGNLHCFDVGREINVNRGGRPPNTDSAPTGRHLQYGHIRSGFMRWQPYGPRESPEYKLIFVHPTVVRDDLPIKPVTTHAVK